MLVCQCFLVQVFHCLFPAVAAAVAAAAAAAAAAVAADAVARNGSSDYNNISCFAD